MATVREGLSLGAQAERLAVRGDRSTPAAATRPVAVVVSWYVAGGATAACASLALGHNPFCMPSWLGASGAAATLLSVGLGLPLGSATIAMTRVVVRRAAWAHALHVALRPGVRGVGDGAVLVLAAASATGEELLFRGLLVPTAGVLASSLLFGVLHQVRGKGRWGWMAWATVMGLLFGGLFAATGNLFGPLVAHAAINHANLRFLRDHDPEPRARSMGGLLKR
jgi:hypothetical protein